MFILGGETGGPREVKPPICLMKATGMIVL